MERERFFVACVPSIDEVGLVQGFSGNVADLGRAEQFMKCVAVIPAIGLRVESAQTKHMLIQPSFIPLLSCIPSSLHSLPNPPPSIPQSTSINLSCRSMLFVARFEDLYVDLAASVAAVDTGLKALEQK